MWQILLLHHRKLYTRNENFSPATERTRLITSTSYRFLTISWQYPLIKTSSKVKYIMVFWRISKNWNRSETEELSIPIRASDCGEIKARPYFIFIISNFQSSCWEGVLTHYLFMCFKLRIFSIWTRKWMVMWFRISFVFVELCLHCKLGCFWRIRFFGKLPMWNRFRCRSGFTPKGIKLPNC